MKFVCIDNSILLISVIKYNNGGITMKKLLVLTTLSLITMQGSTVWGNKETTKEPYKIEIYTFRRCFDDAEYGAYKPHCNKNIYSPQSCHRYLKAIINKMGNGGTILTDNDGKKIRSIKNLNDFIDEAKLPRNAYQASAAIGDTFLLEAIDDDHKNDDPNEKIYMWKDCRNCTALDIALKEMKYYKKKYDDLKDEKKNGNLYPYEEEMIEGFKNEYERRKNAYDELDSNQRKFQGTQATT